MSRNQLIRILRYLGYNVVAVISLLTCSELIVRLTVPDIKPLVNDRHIVIDSAYYQSSGLLPNSSGETCGEIAHIDEHGFRQTSKRTSEATSHLLLVGDSVTFGIGVPDDSIFSARIEATLKSYAVLNPSVIGNTVYDYYNIIKYFLKENALDYDLSHVVVCWCLNDLYEDVETIETPGGVIRFLLDDILLHIRAKSRLYLFLKTLIFDRPKSYYLFDRQFYKPENESFNKAAVKLNEISQLCRDNGADFTLVLLPYEFQHRAEMPDPWLPQELLKHKLASLGFAAQIIDIRFDNFVLLRKPYLYGDGIHFSNYGHKIVAKILLGKLFGPEDRN